MLTDTPTTDAPPPKRGITDTQKKVLEMADWAVGFAAEKWIMSKPDAAKQIASKKLGKKFDKSEFIALIEG